MTCPSCAQPVPDGARFCPSCGHLLVQTEERRIVTVMFADLVGFTALSEERDPEQVKHLVDRCFQRLVADLTAFGGTVDKIVGDGIVALFGAPRAHEDDPERAVRAALRMQRSVSDMTADWGAPIRMRIGVNTGEVLVGAISAGGDYTAMGDTVNLASRLEAAAAPGEVLVGPETVEATRGAIEYEDRGELAVKGREGPTQVSVAVRELAPPGRRRSEARAPLVGRNLEHLQLTSAIDTSIERNRAQLVLILGEAGMGKTRLAEEVAAAVETNHDARVLEGRVLPYGETNPYRPMAEAIAEFLDIEPYDPDDRATEKVTDSVVSILGEGADPGEVDAIVHPIMHILGYESTLQSYDKVRARDEVHAGVRRYLGGLTETQPLVLVLGDVNWADDALLLLLETCLTGLDGSRFVVIATARWTVDDERWIVPPGRHNTTLLNLDALDRAASDRLVRSLMGAEVSEEIASVLYDRSGGNPFFLEELTTLLAEAGASAIDGVAPDPEGVVGDVEELPDTLRGLVSARLDALSPDERTMVEEAAVIGRSGPVYALLLMAERAGRGNPEATFRALVAKDFFATENERWVFRSDLVRDIAYNTLTKTVRARLHVGIADWLSSNLERKERGRGTIGAIAWHYYTASQLIDEIGDVDDIRPDVTEQALLWLDQAGSLATEKDSHYLAGRFFAQALELLPDADPRRIRAATGRARARMGLLELEGARADVHEALDLARSIGDEHGAAVALTLAGEVENLETDYDEARRILRTAIDRWRELGDDAHLAEALRLHGFASMMAGDQTGAEDDYSAALAIFVDIGDTSGEAWCQQNLAWLSFELGHIADAQQRLERAIELFDHNGDAGGLGWAWGLMAFVHFHEGDSAAATEIATRVHAESEVRGDRFGGAMMQLLLASVNLWDGRCHAAIKIGNDALDVFKATETAFGEVQALATLSRAYVAVGQFDEAESALEEARRLADVAPGRPQAAFVRMVSGATAMQQGDAPRALAHLEPLVEEFRDLQIIGSMDRNVTLALAHLQAGDAGSAVQLLDALDPEELSGPVTYYASARALTSLTLGLLDEAVESANVVTASPKATYLDRRAALIALALVEVRRGDEAAARVAFDEAIAMIDSTESRVSQAVTRLARAIGLAALGTQDAAEARDEAELALARLGLAHIGWHTLFYAAAGEERPAAPANV